MTREERERLLELRKLGKRGRPLSPEDRQFVDRMWREFPEEYEQVDGEMLSWLRDAPWWEKL